MSVAQDAGARLAGPLDRLDVRAVLVLIACCACWGVNQAAIKIANAGISPTLQVGLRSIFAGVLVFAWAQLRGVRLFERDGTLWPGLLAGLMFSVEFMVLYIGLDLTTASRGVVLLYLSPFVVAVGAHYLIPGDRLTLAQGGRPDGGARGPGRSGRRKLHRARPADAEGRPAVPAGGGAVGRDHGADPHHRAEVGGAGEDAALPAVRLGRGAAADVGA